MSAKDVMHRAAARSGWILALALTAAAAAPLAAQPAAGGASAADALSATELVVPDAARATPDFDVDRATEAYVDLISPAARARSDAYFEGGYWIQGLSWLWTLGVAALLLGGGRMRRLRDAVRARIRSELGSDLATLAPILIASALLTLPLTIWLGYFREHAYGLSNQTFGAFLGDWAKGLAVGVVLGTPALAAIYAVVRRWPRTWWIRGTGVATMFLVFGVLVGPVFIAPLFNKYEKLEAGALRDDILSMARAHRIPADDVFWFDASKQTKRVSANVSGLGATLRISLNDNLLYRSPRETVLAVLGHEMGHYVLGHVVELILEIALVLAAGFAFLHFAFEPLRRRFVASWRVESLGDPAGWPLASALLATFFLLATPVTNTIIRANEAEADAFGIAVSAEPDGFAYAAVQLSEYRKMRPGALEEFLFYDHPSGYDRIQRAMSWKAENLERMAAREAAAEPIAEADAMPASEAFDHLVWAVADLDAGIAWIEERTGVRAIAGGSHPGGGTRNALLSLGGGHYLEILAPDPAQPESRSGDAAGIAALERPLLGGWAIGVESITDEIERIRSAGLEMVGPFPGSRARPDGGTLSWQTAFAAGPLAQALPFLIEWGAGSPHPSRDAPTLGRLESLTIVHPEPEALRAALARLGVECAVESGGELALRARIATERGPLDL